MGVYSGRGEDVLCRAPPHWSIHKEDADDYIGEGGLSACICIVNGGGEDAGDDLDGELVGSRRGKGSEGINK